MQMNGLKFRKGLGVANVSSISYRLQGQLADVPCRRVIDDARQNGGLQFQVFGDGKLC